jgi:UDP-N-acetylglucosamine transferase subunit ALG13
MVSLLKGATYCSPLVVADSDDSTQRSGALVTVGTVMPFDRMVRGVEDLIKQGRIQGTVAAQIGQSKVKFESMDIFESCPFEELNARMQNADVVICHGGSGSILGALKAGAHVVAMARLQEFGEHYDDHQKDITKAFAQMDLISVAADEHDLERAICEARSRKRRIVHIDPTQFLSAIDLFLEEDKK